MKGFWLCSRRLRLNWLSGVLLFPLALLGESTDQEIHSKVLALLSEGDALVENGNFPAAVSVLNRAIGLIKIESKANQPLREKVERALRITKGRAIVDRYKQKTARGFKPNDPAQSVEPKEVEASQVFGTVFLRGKWEPRSLTKSGESFGLGRRITVSSQSGIELKVLGKDEVKLRAVDTSSFSFTAKDALSVFSGAYVLHVDEDDCRIQLTAPFAELEILSKDPFAVMFGVTTNGGLKLIGLVAKVELRRPREKTVELRPGQLVFALPKGFSRKMYVELSTLMATADLLTAFKEPPDYYKRLKTEALAQALRTRKRFRTLVGDVKNTESFELKVLDEDPK